MGMTAVEKVLARASGAESVVPWDVVYPQPELVFVHDGHVEGCKRELDALGITRLKHPERVVFVTDHEVIYLTPSAARTSARQRATGASTTFSTSGKAATDIFSQWKRVW